MPSIKVVPAGDSLPGRLRADPGARSAPGAPGALQMVGPAAEVATAARGRGGRPGHRDGAAAAAGAGGLALIQVVPASDPSTPATGATIDRLRADAARRRAASAAPRPRTTTSRQLLTARTPLVIGVVLVLGFLLLLVALQAPLVAALGVLTNLLAVGAAFGVAKLVFQDGHLVRPARLRVAGLPRRLGARVLLRDDLRDLDGLHGLPALLGEGALGPQRATRARRWSAASPTRDG